MPLANTLAEQLVRQRTSLGLSQKQSARQIGVDPSTLAKWERGERKPAGAVAKRVELLLANAESTLASAVARTA